MLSLRGLPGIGVIVEDFGPEAERDGLSRRRLQGDVEAKLRAAGIKVLGARSRIVGNRIVDNLFGVYLKGCRHALVEENTIEGRAEVQIGMRGIGSARDAEVKDAVDYGAQIIDAYEMHDIGMAEVLRRIPDGGPYYLTIDADGIDPTIMPAVMAQTPGGLDWLQIRQLVHGLIAKGRVLGMDLVEIAPQHDVGKITMTYAERLICNFIGAAVRADYYCE